MMGDERQIRQVLVLIDGSAAAESAVRYAIALCRAHDATLSGVCLVEHDPRSAGCCMPAGAWHRELDAIAEAELDRARQVEGLDTVRSQLRRVIGTGPRVIADEAARSSCDVLVLPAGGRRHPTRLARQLHQLTDLEIVLVPARGDVIRLPRHPAAPPNCAPDAVGVNRPVARGV